MANRLTQIATRTGDNGTTGLGDNTRVSKNSLRVHAMGDVDELNSHIGLLLCEPIPEGVRTLLVEVQHQLFNLGGELSIPGFELLKPEAVLALDQALAEHNATLPRLAEFILPAGTRAASQAHICRTVARRAERTVVALEQQGLKPLSGCRMGICNTCACGKSSGSTRHLPSGELLHEPTQALKLCIHSAATDLELDL